MKNKEIRDAIAKKRLRHYEIAEKLGISCYTFSVWLRNELPEEKKQRILKAIDEITV